MTETFAPKPPSDHRVSAEDLDELMQVTSPRGWIALIGCALLVGGVFVWSMAGTVTSNITAQGVLFRDGGLILMSAPLDGVVESDLARTGVPLEAGTPLLVVRPDNGPPQTIKSPPLCCRILHRVVQEGAAVKKGASLLLLEDLRKPLIARLYVPVNTGYGVTLGMRVQIAPANVSPSEFGYLQGSVESAAKFPISQQELTERLQNADLAQSLAAGGPKLQILVKLDAAPKGPPANHNTTSAQPKANAQPNTGDCKPEDAYKWSASSGPRLPLYSGTPCQGQIIVAQQRPIQLVFPSVGK